MIHHTPIQLRSYEDFLSKFDDITPLSLLCQLRFVDCQSSYWKASECNISKNENYDPIIQTEAQVTVKAEAFNSFENFPVVFEYFITEQVFSSFYSSLKKILDKQHAVIVRAPLYYLIEGNLVLFSPTLTPTTCPSAQLGFSPTYGGII